MGKKFQKIYLRHYNLVTVQNLWQSHCQVLSIIFLREFIKLNVKLDMIIKSVKNVKLNIKIASAFLNT